MLAFTVASPCALQFDGDGSSYQASVLSVTEKYNKYRKYIIKIADEMLELKEEEE